MGLCCGKREKKVVVRDYQGIAAFLGLDPVPWPIEERVQIPMEVQVAALMAAKPSLYFDRNTKIKLLVERIYVGASAAREILAPYGWDLDQVILEYRPFWRAIDGRDDGDMTPLEIMYDTYKDAEDPSKICNDGMDRFMADLGILDSIPSKLIVAWKMKAVVKGEFSHSQFMEGMTILRCETIGKLIIKLDQLKLHLRLPTQFNSFYSFCYDYALVSGEERLAVTTAFTYWEWLLDEFKYLNEWCFYLKGFRGHKYISKSIWMVILRFSVAIDGDISNRKRSTGSWPIFIEEFVLFVQYMKVHKKTVLKKSSSVNNVNKPEGRPAGRRSTIW